MGKHKVKRIPRDKITRHKTPTGTLSVFTPAYRDEWEKHAEKFADAGGFEDDPKAETADTYGHYETRSVGMDGVQQQTGLSDLWGNGEPTG